MKDDKLENLVKLGYIRSYEYADLDEDGNIGQTGDFRNTQKLILHFSNDHKLTIDCFCSGSSENTVLIIGD